MVPYGMKIFERFKRIKEFYVKCTNCGKIITGRTKKVCHSNFKQHYEGKCKENKK